MAEAHRLPRTVWPREYRVELQADPNTDRFSGQVEIDVHMDAPDHTIEMHAKALQLSQAELQSDDGWVPLSIETNEARETVRFTAKENIPAGKACLRVSFAGKPNPGMHGLYIADDGHERAIATQCEATDARAIFPCFDEPEYKAKLQWTLRAPKNLVALSNGKSAAEPSLEGDDKVWRFESTRSVSSYLAAITMGDYESTPETIVRDTPIRVWAPRGRAQHGEFAHEITERFIPWYEDYFDVPYPYGKYDQVGVPGFDAGAMENVGLVLFRQSLLLMDPDAASWNQEKLIAKVVAHELAHMWFGNWVTMKWWDDLWLNEAFAEWFAHKAIEALAPQYKVWNDFQSDKNRALSDDALPTTHAIYTPVETPDEAIEMFDVITYQKGCAVMRMLENFLGDEPFRAGLQNYMKEFAERNAAGDDLWRHLEASSEQPVRELMGSWVQQPGFPMVSVGLNESKLALSQSRFSSGGEDYGDQTWTIPMVVRFEDEEGVKEHRFLLRDASAQEELPAKGTVRWCYPNAHEIGFYRVSLQTEGIRQLLVHVSKLSVVERMGLIEDQWALLRGGDGDLPTFIDVLGALAQTDDHSVARAVLDRLSTLDNLLERSGEEDARAQLRGLVKDWFEPTMKRLGFEAKEGDSQGDLQLRSLSISALGGLARDPATIERCQHYAGLERADARSVDANLATAFLSVTAKNGDAALHSAWLETYRTRRERGDAPQDCSRYLYTLSSFRADGLAERTLEEVLDGIIPQEAIGGVLGQLMSNAKAQAAAWAFMQNHWDTLKLRVGDMGISRLVASVGRLPAEQRSEIVAFFAANPPKGAERALARALENMDQRARLRARLVPPLVDALNKQVAGS